jgi:uncharacterized membrane protein YdbT with pleckstrin-like domain
VANHRARAARFLTWAKAPVFPVGGEGGGGTISLQRQPGSSPGGGETVSYIEHSLSPGETVIYQTRLHWIVLFWPMVIAAVFGIAGLTLVGYAVSGRIAGGFQWPGIFLALVAVIAIGYGLLARHKTEMAVTTKRVIIKTGILTTRTVELFLAKIESVEVEQSLPGRMLGYGSIFVRGTGGTAEPFSTIAHPLELRRQIQQQIELHMQSPRENAES